MNVSLGEELSHSKSAFLRVVDALKGASILPLDATNDHLSYGECFWEASCKAIDLERALHECMSEECRVLIGK